ncbi:HAD family hydrolase [Sphingobacterium griseoflavum]|nr:HAD family hydrolase [Sphingobacterium griseoflavum]
MMQQEQYKVAMEAAVYMVEVDDLLFPKRDYLLQVYYLFANFVEFTEGRTLAKPLVDFMKLCYEEQGEEAVLPKTLKHFGLPDSYLENFERLRANAHLPLKLFLPDKTKHFLKALFASKKQVGILTDGNPVEQLNKLKHIDWEELSPFLSLLKIFFLKELAFRNLEPLDFLQETYAVDKADICIVKQL